MRSFTLEFANWSSVQFMCCERTLALRCRITWTEQRYYTCSTLSSAHLQCLHISNSRIIMTPSDQVDLFAFECDTVVVFHDKTILPKKFRHLILSVYCPSWRTAVNVEMDFKWCPSEWLGSRVVSVLDSGAVGPGFKSQPRRCRVTVLGKLFTPIVPLFTKQRNW